MGGSATSSATKPATISRIVSVRPQPFRDDRRQSVIDEELQPAAESGSPRSRTASAAYLSASRASSAFKVGIGVQDVSLAHAVGNHADDRRDPDAQPADPRDATHLIRSDRDPRERHRCFSLRWRRSGRLRQRRRRNLSAARRRAQPSAGITSAASRSSCCASSTSGLSRVSSAPASATARMPAVHASAGPARMCSDHPPRP